MSDCVMEKEIKGKLCKRITSKDLKDNGLSEKSIKYYEDYGYEIWLPVEDAKYIYVYEPDDTTDYKFAMEFLSYKGMDEAFSLWDDLAKEGWFI